MNHALLKALLLPALALGTLSLASDLEVFGLVRTRDQADHTLSKSYDFKVMRDGSVRRSWKLNDSRLSMDFDAGSNRLICIVVDYDKPVKSSAAARDAMELTGATIKKWQKLSSRKAKQFGLKNVRACKLRNGSYVFREGASGGRCRRLVIYTARPNRDRFELEEFTGLRRTALGTAGGSADLSFLVSDEEARRARPADPRLAVRREPTPSPGSGDAAAASPAGAEEVDLASTEEEGWLADEDVEEADGDAAAGGGDWLARMDEWATPLYEPLRLASLSPALRVAVVYGTPLVVLVLLMMLVARIRRTRLKRRLERMGQQLRDQNTAKPRETAAPSANGDARPSAPTSETAPKADATAASKEPKSDDSPQQGSSK